ncbi:hypothetical protein [Streptomyces sp. NPDC001980]|uniref:hypothetical protein n=1 Tax=Streptomyces sp. NPDC001980 TaxID=3157126 RepID=UPI003323EF9B
MEGVAGQARRPGTGRDRAVGERSASWRGPAVLVALMLAAFTFNTAENLPVGLLELVSGSLRVSLSAVATGTAGC